MPQTFGFDITRRDEDGRACVPTRILLPKAVHDRPLRIGPNGDVRTPLAADLIVFVKTGQLVLASAAEDMRARIVEGPPQNEMTTMLPTWLVPVSLPVTVEVGDASLRFFACILRPSARGNPRRGAVTVPALVVAPPPLTPPSLPSRTPMSPTNTRSPDPRSGPASTRSPDPRSGPALTPRSGPPHPREPAIVRSLLVLKDLLLSLRREWPHTSPEAKVVFTALLIATFLVYAAAIPAIHTANLQGPSATSQRTNGMSPDPRRGTARTSPPPDPRSTR